MYSKRISIIWCVALALLSTTGPVPVLACGGFFCQQVPIDQAGEQIIFRQDGNMVTAVVLIQYEGAAEDFSWVVPVPGIPELSTGSDLVFGPLELATRPQFDLTITGSRCPESAPGLFPSAPVANDESATGGDADDDGVEILQSLAVGPFDTVVVRSDDPEALATWLEENNYELTTRGPELIEPYVELGMNFVALRLRQDQGIGDLQPLIMRYESDIPMIPIRLTAVAALPDMGVIVWILGEARAVPLNYLHVVPNYTRLNWYAGTTSAYASYQGLITAAMNEAQMEGGPTGQGFATDYAGTDLDYVGQLPTPEPLSAEHARLAAVEDDAQYVAELAGGFVFPNDKIMEILRRELPLPEGLDEFLYTIPAQLSDIFTPEELATARADISQELQTSVIEPLEETLAVFDGELYTTRLYTTLSADEMTLDPTFSFNPDLEDQPLARSATMNVACVLGRTEWTLTLGPGTGRDGEVVINGLGDPPGFASAPPTVDQDSLFRSETVSTSGPPNVVQQKQFPTLQTIGPGADDGLCGNGAALCGSGAAGMLMFTLFGLRLLRGRRR